MLNGHFEMWECLRLYSCTWQSISVVSRVVSMSQNRLSCPSHGIETWQAVIQILLLRRASMEDPICYFLTFLCCMLCCVQHARCRDVTR